MNKTISLLGSTGSIGTQTLSVARMHNIKVRALSANRNVKLLSEQAREFLPDTVCVADKSLYNELRLLLSDIPVKTTAGSEGLLEIASLDVDIMVNALVGMVGLLPTLEAINSGNDIALANKETLVAGGALVMSAAKEKNVRILPVDSEHSAIFQCLNGNNRSEIRKIILTASGGPFFGYTPEMLMSVKKEDALKHPNWSMGSKITIDSATLMNKGLEFIEAMWLFDVAPSQIEVVVHRQSIVHSAVEFADGSVIAQMGTPDMRVPIQYAVTYPNRYENEAKRLSILECGTLTFEPVDDDTFKCLKLAKLAAKKGGNAGCIINSANERAVAAFLEDEISFCSIPELVESAYYSVNHIENPTLPQILETEQQAHMFVEDNLRR